LEVEGVDQLDMFGGFEQVENMTEQHEELMQNIIMTIQVTLARRK
jgi:hypothetical protein